MTIPDIDLSSRSLLASYPTYAEAQHTVDLLSDRGFPMAGVLIVGTDVRMVEVVTGRLTTGGAALAGASSGAWFGLLIGVIIGLGTPFILAPILWGLLWGAIFGAIFGAVGHAALRGTRDFSSSRRMVAGRYDVLVEPQLLLRAQQTAGIVPGGSPPLTA
jgi:hypothetical protein